MTLAANMNVASDQAVGGPFRVLIVDDSAVIRGIIARWLEEDPSIKVVATAPNGLAALRTVQRADAELVILDIEMPEMDGLTALPKLIELVPDIQIIMASTLTKRNADISMRAIQRGAVDYIAKPETKSETAGSIDFRRDLLEKVKAFGAVLRRRRQQALPDGRSAQPQAAPLANARAAMPRPAATPTATATTRQALPQTLPWPPRHVPKLIAIGSSTGGPQALFEMMKALAPGLNVPVVITQHMPPTFTAILAEHLRRQTGLSCAEAKDGERLLPGHVYVAPGDHHLLIENQGRDAIARIDQSAPENFCRPAVDPMFRSAAKAFGDKLLGVVLTGMGQDGTNGARDIIAKGGAIIAQDEASSVVWGMPGSIAKAGLCNTILPLKEIGPKVHGLLKGATS